MKLKIFVYKGSSLLENLSHLVCDVQRQGSLPSSSKVVAVNLQVLNLMLPSGTVVWPQFLSKPMFHNTDQIQLVASSVAWSRIHMRMHRLVVCMCQAQASAMAHLRCGYHVVASSSVGKREGGMAFLQQDCPVQARMPRTISCWSWLNPELHQRTKSVSTSVSIQRRIQPQLHAMKG